MLKKMLILSGLALFALNGAVSADEEKESILIAQYDEEEDYILASDDSEKVKETILASYDEEDSLLVSNDEQDYEADEEYELV